MVERINESNLSSKPALVENIKEIFMYYVYLYKILGLVVSTMASGVMHEAVRNLPLKEEKLSQSAMYWHDSVDQV